MNKRTQRTQAKFDLLIERYKAEGPMTVRRCYYVLLSTGLINEVKYAYQGVSKLLVKARVEGSVPWELIEDNARRIIKRPTYSSFEDSFDDTCEYFKLNSMDQQDKYVEVWLEKDTAASGISQTTYNLDVPLIVAKGFSSATYVKNAADRFKSIDKPIHIVYISDFDPEGNYFPQLFEEHIRERFGFEGQLEITKLSLTKEDIKEEELTWIPIKWKSKNSKKKQMQKQYFKDYVAANGLRKVELDAMPGDVLSKKLLVALNEIIDFDLIEKNEELSKECLDQWKETNLKVDQ